MTKRTSIECRFWAKVRKTKTCWLWAGGTNGRGYGQLNLSSPKRNDCDEEFEEAQKLVDNAALAGREGK